MQQLFDFCKTHLEVVKVTADSYIDEAAEPYLKNTRRNHKLMCTDCDEFACQSWTLMQEHYAKKHPDVKNPGKYFTKEAKAKK